MVSVNFTDATWLFFGEPKAPNVAADTIPDPFTFVDLVDRAPGAGPFRGTAMITGVDVGEQLTVAGGELSNDGGATWQTTPLAMVAGATFVRSGEIFASPVAGGVVNAQPTIVNGVFDVFSVMTSSAAPNPTPRQFSFPGKQAAPLTTAFRGEADILDVTPGELLTVTNGELSNDGGATWQTAPLAMVLGLTRVRSDSVVSAASFSTQVSAPATTVNAVSAIFSVTTGRDPALAVDAVGPIRSPFRRR